MSLRGVTNIFKLYIHYKYFTKKKVVFHCFSHILSGWSWFQMGDLFAVKCI